MKAGEERVNIRQPPPSHCKIFAPVAQLVEREAYTLCMHQISARFQVRTLAGVPLIAPRLFASGTLINQ